MTRARTRVQFFSLIWRVRKFAAMSTCSLGGIAHSEVIVLLHYGSLLQYTLIAYRYQCLCDITIGCTVLALVAYNRSQPPICQFVQPYHLDELRSTKLEYLRHFRSLHTKL
ncbi:hypothetical protein H4582DRAFT_2019546 [Lactarius indigo]|nr:hypothetical protein H4582DRAFT_2019546 [Lactarius indigo]